MRFAVPLLALTLAACATPAAQPPPAAPPPRAALAPVTAGSRCCSCGREVSGAEALRWPDGRFTCGGCHATSVVELEDARACLREALGDLRRLFDIDLGAAPIAFDLVDHEALARRAGADLASPMLQAVTWFWTGWPASTAPEGIGVEVVYGLPRGALRGVLVHELFHVHQALVARAQGKGLADPRSPGVELAFVEGAALWAQRRALADVGQHGLAERLDRDPDPTYGGGLRRFRKLVSAVGEPRALELGASAGRFPSGH